MALEVVKQIGGAGQTPWSQTHTDGGLPTTTHPERTPAHLWYKGPLLLPSPGVTAIFNGPIFRIGNGNSFGHMPRVMDRPQIPGTADKTARFDVYELEPDLTGVIQYPSIQLDSITGDGPVNKLYGIEDIRVTSLDDGSLGCAMTAEFGGKPYPALFIVHPTESDWKVEPMQLMIGAGMGKNTLLLDRNTALHRLETENDKIAVIQRNQQTNRWSTIDTIHFPHITKYNDHAKLNGGGNKRIGLTGGERIPMPNGHFRMIMHEVTHSAGDHDNAGNISEYSFRLAEFQLDERGIPKVVAVDPKPLLTYDQVVELAGPGEEPDPKKRVIYSTGGVLNNNNQFLLPVTVRDREEHLFAIPLRHLQRPFA